MTSFAIALALTLLGQDDRAPETPYTPPIPAEGQAPEKPGTITLTQAQLDDAIERAVSRALARYPQSSPAPSGQQAVPAPPPVAQPVQASVQQPIVLYVQQPAPQPVQAVQQPAQAVNVLVPPGPCKRMMAAFGQHLAEKGAPRLRTMQLAPTAYTPAISQAVYAQPTYAPASAQPVTASPQAATLPLPAAQARLTLPAKSPPAKGGR